MSLDNSNNVATSSETLSTFERAKSIFRGDENPYCPSKLDAPKLFLESDGYHSDSMCSARWPHEDLFKKKLQGLLKIHFSSGMVTEQIDRIEAAMREGANAQTYSSHEIEIVHRLSWLLAEHLDTPDKMTFAITSIAAASN